MTVAVKKQPGAVRADPEIAFRIGNKTANGPKSGCIRDRALNQLERESVEANQASLGADPKITVPRLADSIDGPSHEPLVGIPVVLHIL
jgi:hypothetical protein